MSSTKCLLCKAPASIASIGTTFTISLNCVRCGQYRCDHSAAIVLRNNNFSKQQLGAASGYIRRNQGLLVTDRVADFLGTLTPPTPPEKATTILIELGKQSPQPGAALGVAGEVLESALEKIKIDATAPQSADPLLDQDEMYALELMAIASLSDGSELDWFLHRVLEPQGLIYSNQMFVYAGMGYQAYSVSPSGWQEIVRLQESNAASRIAFVAMSFDPQFIPLYEQAIAPGIQAAGYEAVRVDRTEHNNRIDDEMIARIRRSRFLVADFTRLRGGTYFEAGYALGLGLPVIWLARMDTLNDVHFDNRQYNFLEWQEGSWSDLRNRLHFRIEATIGRGPGPDT